EGAVPARRVVGTRRKLGGANARGRGRDALGREHQVLFGDLGAADRTAPHVMELHEPWRDPARLVIRERVEPELPIAQALRGAGGRVFVLVDVRGLEVDDRDATLALVDAIPAAGHQVRTDAKLEGLLDLDRPRRLEALALQEARERVAALRQAALLVLARN